MSGGRAMPGADRKRLRFTEADGRLCIYNPENEEEAWIDSDYYEDLEK